MTPKQIAEQLLVTASAIDDYYRPFKFNPQADFEHPIATYFAVATNHAPVLARAYLLAMQELEAFREREGLQKSIQPFTAVLPK